MEALLDLPQISNVRVERQPAAFTFRREEYESSLHLERALAFDLLPTGDAVVHEAAQLTVRLTNAYARTEYERGAHLCPFQH